MKLRYVFIAALLVTSVLLPLRADAGCCTISTTKACWSDADLLAPEGPPPEGGWTKARICLSMVGTYDTGCSCPGANMAQTQCCILLDGTCQAPGAGGTCPALSSPSARPCSALSCRVGKPAAEPVNVRFKPQLTLPGSNFIAGQEVLITGATLGEYIAALYAFVVGAVGILATVMVFYGGIIWLTAAGDRGKVQNAKETISSAIIGVVLALTAYLLLLLISPKLVKFTSLSLRPVPTIEQQFGEGGTPGEYGRMPAGTIALTGLTQTWFTNMKNVYGSYITSALQAHPNIEEKLVYALIFIESSGDPNAQSGLACGLMQVKPSTAGYTNCAPLLDPQTNIQAGVSYLATLFQAPCPSGSQCNSAATKCPSTNHSQDYTYVLAAYNAGPGANCYSGGSGCNDGRTKWECPLNEQPPPKGYQQTREYVPKVKQALEKIRTFN